jgi:hypothetical protein
MDKHNAPRKAAVKFRFRELDGGAKKGVRGFPLTLQKRIDHRRA